MTDLPSLTLAEAPVHAPAHSCIVFLLGEDANEVLDVLHDHTPGDVVWSGPTVESVERALPYLTAYDSGDLTETIEPGTPWEPSDNVLIEGDYVITWNVGLSYISLYRRVEVTER